MEAEDYGGGWGAGEDRRRYAKLRSELLEDALLVLHAKINFSESLFDLAESAQTIRHVNPAGKTRRQPANPFDPDQMAMPTTHRQKNPQAPDVCILVQLGLGAHRS